MIRLARHIETLLLGNECVIVPDLGGFVAHHLTARYDSDEMLFLPPYRTLGFNPQLKMNDSLLAKSYADAYGLSYDEAVKVVEDEVADLLDILANSGSFELNNLGRLFYDGDGKLNFEPCEAGILSPEFYALSSFSMPPIADETVSSDTENEVRRPRVVYIGSENGHKTLNISLRAVRNISVAAVIIATVFLVAIPLRHNTSSVSSGNIESGFYEILNPSHKSKGKPIAGMLQYSASKKHSDTQVKTNAAQEKSQVPEQKIVKPQKEHYWSIVLCVGVPRSNADRLVDEVKADGHPDAFVFTDKNVKVLYGKYSSWDEAHNDLKKLRPSKNFTDGWILEVNN